MRKHISPITATVSRSSRHYGCESEILQTASLTACVDHRILWMQSACWEKQALLSGSAKVAESFSLAAGNEPCCRVSVWLEALSQNICSCEAGGDVFILPWEPCWAQIILPFIVRTSKASACSPKHAGTLQKQLLPLILYINKASNAWISNYPGGLFLHGNLKPNLESSQLIQ